MDRISLAKAKLVRLLSATMDHRGTTIQHDYGSLVVPWETITHLFGARIKKMEQVPYLVIAVLANEALYYVEGSTFNFKSFLKNEVTNRRESNFIHLVKIFAAQAQQAYIDWPLRDSIQGGISLLPDLGDINKLNEYCQKGRLQAQEQKTGKQEAPSEDSFSAIFLRTHELFAQRRKEGMRYLSRAQGILARSLEERHHTPEARQELLRKTINELDLSIRTDPYLLQAYALQGELHQALNQHTHAGEFFTKALDLDPSIEGDGELAHIILCRGLAKLHSVKGNNEGMLWALYQYIGLFPMTREAAQCADIASRIGGLSEGAEWFHHFTSFYRHWEKGERAPALESINRSIGRNNRFRWAHHWKGILLVESGSEREALDSFEAANRCHYDALTDLEMASLCERAAKYDEAEDILKRIISILPGYYLPHIRLAQSLFRHRGIEKESIDHLMKAIEIKPDGEFIQEAERLAGEISVEQIKRRDQPAMRKEWVKGEIIENRYEVQKIIKGGMGIVYIVIDRQQSKPYAMKSFQDQFLWDDRIIRMFVKEAEVWVKLGAHRNIVRAEYVKDFEGKPYIFLEFISGTDLEHRLGEGPLDVQMATEYALQFCEGMNYAYKKLGVVHRDIKPSNCMITEDGVLKITDFGLVKIFAEESEGGGQPHERVSSRERPVRESGGSLSTSTGGVGTLPYMAPEQFMSPDQITTRTDIYSFGAMLFEMMVGRTPFGNESMEQCINGHIYEEPADPCSFRDDIPRELCDIILKCLAKDQADRFFDFEELMLTLNAFYEKTFGLSFIVSTITGEVTVDEIMRKGESMKTLGRLNEALELFNEGLRKSPQSMRLLVDKGECLYHMGRLQEAFTLLDGALKLEPHNADVWYHRGNVFSSARKFNEALQCYEKALHFDAHKAEVWSRKGAMYDLMGHPHDALKCYDRAIKISPKLAEAWNNKGNLLSRMDRIQDAVECYSKAIEINPRYVMAWYNKGLLLQKLNDHNDAIDSFTKVTELDARFVNAWVGSGASHFKIGRTDEALHCFSKALALEPKNFHLWLFKGNALNEMGRLEEAASCFEVALKVNDQNIQAWIGRGAVLSELYYLDEAIECYDRALQLHPNNEFVVKAFFRLKQKKNRLSLHEKRGQSSGERMTRDAMAASFDSIEKMIQHHSCLLEIYPGDAVVWYRKGLLLTLTGKNDEAAACFERALSIDPFFIPPVMKEERACYLQMDKGAKKKGLIGIFAGREKASSAQLFDRGMALYGRKDYGQALKLLNEGLQYQPECIDGWRFAALCLYKLGYHDKALDSVVRGLARDPLDVELWDLKGRILQVMGHHKSAMEAFELTFRLMPSYIQGWIDAIICVESVSLTVQAREFAVKALYYLEREYEKDPGNQDYFRNMGILTAVLERYDQARQFFGEAINRNPDDYSSWNLTGDALYRLGQPDEALKCFAGAEKREPGNTRILLRKALCQRDLGMTDEALKSLDEIIGRDPSFEWAWYFKGIMLAETGERQAGLRFFNESMEKVPQYALLWASRGVFLYKQLQYKDALWCFDKAIELNPWDINFWMNKGILLNKLTMPAEAVPCFDKILDREDENVRAWYFKGISLFIMKEWERAIECCNKVIEINPRIVDAWTLKGVSLFRREKLQEALFCLDRSLELDPERADVWTNRGVLWRRMEKFEEAIKSYNKALEVDPCCAPAWFNKGRWLSELSRFEEAIECFDRQLEADPRNVLAWRDKGHCHYELGRYAEALRCYDRAIKLDPSWESFDSKGLALYLMGRLEESLSAFEKALESEQHSADLWNHRGLVLMKLNRRLDALDAFERCIKIDEEYEAALHNRALALFLLNHRKAAEDALRKLMEINPNFNSPDTSQEGILSRISPIRKNAGIHLMVDFKMEYDLSVKKPPHCFMES